MVMLARLITWCLGTVNQRPGELRRTITSNERPGELRFKREEKVRTSAVERDFTIFFEKAKQCSDDAQEWSAMDANPREYRNITHDLLGNYNESCKFVGE